MLDAALLGHRYETFAAVFEHARRHMPHPVIVETGCLREPGNYAGDGQSTLLFDRLVQELGGCLTSVDIAHASVAAARSLVGHRAQVFCDDSVRFLSRWSRPIDLLYLDSLDFDGNQPTISATHHLFELCAAMQNLRRGSVVLVDDTSRRTGRWFGKGMLIADFMEQSGRAILCEGETQVAWVI